MGVDLHREDLVVAIQRHVQLMQRISTDTDAQAVVKLVGLLLWYVEMVHGEEFTARGAGPEGKALVAIPPRLSQGCLRVLDCLLADGERPNRLQCHDCHDGTSPIAKPVIWGTSWTA